MSTASRKTTATSVTCATRRLLAWFCLGLLPAAVDAAEYKHAEDVPPKTVEDIDSSMSNVLGKVLLYRGPIARAVDEWRKDKSPFLRDGSLNFNFRTMDFDYEITDSVDIEAWAAPGELAYRSGRWRDLLTIGASVYGSYEIDGNENAGRSGLLQANGDDITTLGLAYVELERNGWGGRFYRQAIDVAYLNRNDSRMVPNTFEAYLVGREGTVFDFHAGYVDRIKARDQEDFVSMARAAGAENHDSGTALLSVLWRPDWANFDWGATYQHTSDLFRIFYTEARWTDDVFGLGVRGAVQYTYQESLGQNLVGDFSTYAAGLKLSTSFRNAVLNVAYTSTGDTEIISPFGGRPSYTSSMIRDFDRSGEDAWRVGLSYHMDELGLHGWSATVSYASGNDARTGTHGFRLPDNREVNCTVDYRPETGPLQGLWFRVRYAQVNESGANKVADQLRIILNYSLSIL